MKYLVLGPGALGFFAMLGYLTKIESELSEVEEISGASAGAILGFFLLSGKSLQEIFEASINVDMIEMTKVDLKTFINSFGFINHELIKQKLIEIWGGNPTFSELPKKLYVSAYCLDTLDVEYFSRDTHPDMYVVDAVCASLSIPFVISSYMYNGKRYIDGSTNELTPVGPFLNKMFSDVFCVEIRQSNSRAKVETLVDYCKCIASTVLRNRKNYVDVPSKVIDVTQFDILDLRAPFETRLKLFTLGHGS
jgi:predicted acylesterase/phospholipase RssA